MDSTTEKIFKNLYSKKVGVFYDGSNLYHAYQKYGWRIDLKKFKKLISEYCDLQFINFYVVIPAKNDTVYHGTQRFLERIKFFVRIKKKKLKYTPVGGRVIKKGNMDIEITLDVVRTINDLDVVIIASGDSDFYELKNYVVKEKGKTILFVGYEENMAWELRQCWHIYLNRVREMVEFKK